MPTDGKKPDLPNAAVDHGEHIEVRPTRSSRVLSAVVGGVFAVLGAVIAIFGPGDFVDPLPRFGIGALLFVVGVVVLVARTRRLQLDAEGVALRSLVRSRSLTWDQVAELAVEERLERAGRVGTFSRRVGFLTVSAGSGGRRGPGRGAVRTQRVVRLEARASDSGNEIAMELDGADLDEGYALVQELRGRSWLPDNVKVPTG